ncbi:MAG: hypothetical protein ACYTBJ_26360 [Planctomycetota bacterium]|jgi:hypothetical protein
MENMKLIGQYSILGTGLRIYGIKRFDDDRVRFTLWISILFLPLIPISTWSATYIAPAPCHLPTDEQHFFCNLIRLTHDYAGYLRTCAAGILAYLAAICPTAIMILITRGRAATKVELVFVLASAIWPVIMLIHFLEKRKPTFKGDSFHISDWLLKPTRTLKRIFEPDGAWLFAVADPGEVLPLAKGVVLRPLDEVILAFPAGLFGPHDKIASVVRCDDEALFTLQQDEKTFCIRLKPGMFIRISKSCEFMVVPFDEKDDRPRRFNIYRPAELRPAHSEN